MCLCEQVFDRVGLPLAHALLTGSSSVLLTFGVTNSGKSHTVIGSSTPEGAGLIARLFKHFLSQSTDAPLKFAALEVYNDRYFDLIKDTSTGKLSGSMSSGKDTEAGSSRPRPATPTRVSVGSVAPSDRVCTALPPDVSLTPVSSEAQALSLVQSVR